MKTSSNKNISKLGIGTYGVGGRGHRDMEITEKVEDEKYIEALVYMIKKGLNFTEISLGYGHGKALDLFKLALDQSSVKREDIFLTHSLYPRDLVSVDVVNKDILDFYKIMNTSYVDSTLVTQSLILKFGKETIYPILHKLLKTNKTRYVSLSNAGLECIKDFKNEFDNKFIAHEGHLSFEVRALQEKGILDLCDNLSVKNIIWRPLRRGKTLNITWPLLKELATKYEKTYSQIILNWMFRLSYYPMVFSVNTAHIDENIEASNFIMEDDDYQRINDFRPPNYKPPEINWDGESHDSDIVSIVSLTDNFEGHLKP